MFYKRFCKGLTDKGTLVPWDTDFRELIDDPELDYYTSLFDYSDSHFKTFKSTKSVAGFKDVTTSVLLWDFDNEENLEEARTDAVALCTRLIRHGVDQKDIRIYFSGKKGFGVQVDTLDRFTVQEFKNICFNVANGLNFDKAIYNSNRIIRFKGTKHQTTGLYKYPLTFNQLTTFEIQDILVAATSLENITPDDFSAETIELPVSLNELRSKIPENIKTTVVRDIIETRDLDWKLKPKWLSNCKWALQNGFFQQGVRSNALVCLAATYKNQGFDQDIAYRMLKGVCELQAERNKCERFPDNELYNNVVQQVYSPSWQNGQYSCKEEGWLHDFCQSLGEHTCKHDEGELQVKKISSVLPEFKDMVVNIDKYTIKTGIESLDKALFITTNSYICLLGAPASGKTSLVLNMLNNASEAGIESVFCSFDMAHARLYEKLCYRETGMGRDQLFELFRQNREAEVDEVIEDKFKNVFIMPKAGSVKDIKAFISECNKQAKDRIKLVVIDYFELIQASGDNEVTNSKNISTELKTLVNEENVCVVLIVQPTKEALGQGPDKPLWNYSKIKGSGAIYQNARGIVSVWRSFATPKYAEKDKYIEVAVIKNDMGELSHHVLNWNGKRGLITECNETEKTRFEQWALEKKVEEEANDPWNNQKFKKS